MCPEEERIRRIQEADAHKLELLQEYGNANFYRQTMIKKLQKSSADHSLQIAEHLRTPETLLRTIKYIEDVLMDKSNDNQFAHGDTSAKLVVYLYIWDRYRMIAKDYTLQSSAIPVTDIWLECHERMARWMIYMDHEMRTEGELIVFVRRVRFVLKK
jgi:23S rRNA A1618 N6-methylase RlmF